MIASRRFWRGFFRWSQWYINFR